MAKSKIELELGISTEELEEKLARLENGANRAGDAFRVLIAEMATLAPVLQAAADSLKAEKVPPE